MTTHDNTADSGGIRVILSTGIGRLHLVQAALWLLRAGVDIRVIQGWLPLLSERWLQRAGRLIRHPGLVYGMRQRRPAELEGRLASCAAAEFLQQILSRLVRGQRAHWRIARLSWRFFGFLSRRHLHDADIFHVRSGAGQGGAIRVARARGMKVVVDHSIAHPRFMEQALRDEYARYGSMFAMGPDDPFWRLVLQDCEDADVLLVNSDFVKETFVATGYPAEKIRVVYLGVRPDFCGLRAADAARPAGPGAEPFRLLFTGGFGFRKGAAYLLEALRLLVARGRSVHLTVVGAYQEAAPLLASHAGDRLPITLVGHIPQDELKRHLQAADLYVFPSLAEGCASSGMEALAAGLCVVATRESGLPIRDGENGLLVASADAAALAERVAWAIDHPAECARLGAAAAAGIAQHFTWPCYAGKVLDVYREAMGPRASMAHSASFAR